MLVAPDGEHIPMSFKLWFPSTNIVAEFEACLLGLNALGELGVRAVEVYGNSFLVIAQTQGKWKTKDETLLLYHDRIVLMRIGSTMGIYSQNAPSICFH